MLCLALSGAPAAVRAQRGPVAGDETGKASLDPRAVAVLPFANISGEPSDDWIGAGIAETVSADLSRLGMVSVVTRATLPSRNAGTARPSIWPKMQSLGRMPAAPASPWR